MIPGGYISLFLASFLAATLLPAQSELGLAVLYGTGGFALWALVLVASIGNTLGSVINWMLGRGIDKFRNRSWFPVSAASLSKAQQRYQKYGRWSLLLSWVPIIGDPLTLVAGMMREPFWRFLAIVACAKTGRYIVLALVVQESVQPA